MLPPRWLAQLPLLFAAGLLPAGLAAAAVPEIENCTKVPVERHTSRVDVDTLLGKISLELYANIAPNTVANFLGYIQSGAYDDTLVHRIDKLPGDIPFVIQMGGYRHVGLKFESIPRGATVDNEPCLSNVEGTIAMAKLGGLPDSATSEWFINLTDNNLSAPMLDDQNGGFTVFGRVTAGLDVANAIVNLVDRLPVTPIPGGDGCTTPTSLTYSLTTTCLLESLLVESPLTSAYPDDASLGCFDSTNLAFVMNIEETLLEFHPEAPSELFYLVSPSCDPSPEGAASNEPLAIECNQLRTVALADVDALLLLDENENPVKIGISCAGIEASDAAYAVRAQALSDRLVRTQYTITQLPELESAWLCGAALLTLAALRRLSSSA